MEMVRSQQVRFSGDPTVRFQMSRTREPLTPARLFVQRDPFFGASEVLPAVPWGLLVPGETVFDGGSSFARIRTLSTPPESTFHLYFEIEGGGRYEQSHLYVGAEPEVTLPLPREWMTAAMGKRVTLDYAVEWRDGTWVTGPKTLFRVHPPLEIPPIQIEGVQYGEALDPAQLPDVINLTIDRVRNLESFHDARLRLMVGGEKDGWLGPALDYHFPLDAVGEGAQCIEMFRWYLTYPYEQGYTNVKVDFLFRSTMLPPPNTTDDWGSHVRMGMNNVLPPSS